MLGDLFHQITCEKPTYYRVIPKLVSLELIDEFPEVGIQIFHLGSEICFHAVVMIKTSVCGIRHDIWL